jgi:hypothetical protein
MNTLTTVALVVVAIVMMGVGYWVMTPEKK